MIRIPVELDYFYDQLRFLMNPNPFGARRRLSQLRHKYVKENVWDHATVHNFMADVDDWCKENLRYTVGVGIYHTVTNAVLDQFTGEYRKETAPHVEIWGLKTDDDAMLFKMKWL